MLLPLLHTGSTAAETSGASSASPVIRAAPLQTQPAQNRAGPKRRKGKEGSDEAELDAEQARELFIRRTQRLEQIQSRQQEIAKDQRTLATNRARMHARLIETAKALRLSEKRLSELEDHLAKTRAQIKDVRERLEDKSAQMSGLFILMQGMSRQPPPFMVTHSKDALKMIRSGMVLAAFYADVEKLAAQISGEVDKLDRAQKEAELQEQRHKAEQAHNGRLKGQLEAQLVDNHEQLEMATEDLENLKSASQINIAGLKSLEEILPALDAAAKPAKPAGARELASGPTQLAALQPGRIEPSIAFSNSQGLLPMPVQGRVLTKFGQPGGDGAPSRGVHIETRPGAQVVSPCDGSILYAGPFRSYGQLLIIDPGGGYHVVIAGMDHIQVSPNQAILAGEPLATMSAEPRSSEKTFARPILYVEFRRDQQTIDPAPWWPSGGKG